MSDENAPPLPNASLTVDGSAAIESDPQVELAAYFSKPGYEKYGRFIFAALSAIPWIGGVIAASPDNPGRGSTDSAEEPPTRPVCLGAVLD